MSTNPLKIFEEEMTKLKNSLSHLERRLSKLQDHPFKTANDLINDYLEKQVVIRLRNGLEITGTYTRYDKYHILIESDGKPTLVFKHAIESLHEGDFVKELIDALQSHLADLKGRCDALESGTEHIATRGAKGTENLLTDLIGQRLAFSLSDGRTIEGVLQLNQLRCLKILTDDGKTLIVNTRFINALTVAGGKSKK